MREFKFRSWNNGFVFFDLIEDNDCDFYRFYCSASDIVEQYTGLKDKNGKEIYENDVVRADIWYNGKLHPRYFSRGIVIFRQQSYMITDSIDSTTHNEPLGSYTSGELEVIGNVHENPEILGGEK